jgi:hypothetical protein
MTQKHEKELIIVSEINITLAVTRYVSLLKNTLSCCVLCDCTVFLSVGLAVDMSIDVSVGMSIGNTAFNRSEYQA